jgi:tyrosine-protein kinase Etk/Wzc
MTTPVPPSDFDAWRALAREAIRRRRLVLGLTGAITAVMLVYVLVMPQTFTSTVTILPPQKESSPFALGALMQSGGAGLGGLDIGASLGLGGRPSDLFAEILRSQSVADSLIIQHRLDRFFDMPAGLPPRAAAEQLAACTEIEINKNGVIALSVTLGTGWFAGGGEVDSIKRFTASVANDYVLWLDRINREKLISSARNSRVFIQEELRRTQRELDTTYAQMVRFQRENRTLFLDKQMEAALTGAATLKEKLMAAQAEMQVKRRDFSESSRAITELQAEIEGLAKQYDALSTGQGAGVGDYFVPFQRLPAVARDMAGYMRQVKTLEQVMLFLGQQYYQERVQEARDTPTVQVLDRAMPAIQRTAPKRAVWLLTSAIAGLLAAIGYVMLLAYRDARSRAAAPAGRNAGTADGA